MLIPNCHICIDLGINYPCRSRLNLYGFYQILLLPSLINEMNKIPTMQVTVGEWFGDSEDGNDDQIVSGYDKSPLTTSHPAHCCAALNSWAVDGTLVTTQVLATSSRTFSNLVMFHQTFISISIQIWEFHVYLYRQFKLELYQAMMFW